MVFMAAGDAEAEALDSSSRKATLDDSDIEQDEVPRALQKVELDLDDAPFLDEDEDEEEVEEALPEPEIDEAPKKEKKPLALPGWLNKKLIILALAALLVVSLGAGGVTYLLMKPAPEPAEEEEAPAPEAEELPPVASDTIADREITLRMEPYWVEKTTPDGKTAFLHCKFAIATRNKALVQEINHKTLVLRDAVYYYLTNKNYEFLADSSNMESLKKDLLSVLNKYLGNGQLETILVEEYLVK